ncbi:MAG: hypothetical protein QXT35_04620 [Conexivisphaerales archaeon]
MRDGSGLRSTVAGGDILLGVQEGDSVSSRRFQKAELSLKVLLYSKFQSM